MQLPPLIFVKCFSCNDELSTTNEEWRSGRRSECQNCGVDLRPTHTDPTCGFCMGRGAAVVNGIMWVCQMGGREA